MVARGDAQSLCIISLDIMASDQARSFMCSHPCSTDPWGGFLNCAGFKSLQCDGLEKAWPRKEA